MRRIGIKAHTRKFRVERLPKRAANGRFKAAPASAPKKGGKGRKGRKGKRRNKAGSPPVQLRLLG